MKPRWRQSFPGRTWGFGVNAPIALQNLCLKQEELLLPAASSGHEGGMKSDAVGCSRMKHDLSMIWFWNVLEHGEILVWNGMERY